MAVAAFTSDRDALEFLYGGPAPDPQLDIEPEAQPPMDMQLGPDRLIAAADAAMVNDLDANGEPPLPMDEAEDAPLPPVQQPGAGSMERGATEPFGSDEEALAFLRGEVVERTAEPAVPTDGGFATDEEALSFLRTPEPQAETPKQAFEFTGAMGTLAVNGQQVPVGGKITFDPARLTQGLQGAYQAGLISEQDYTSAIENAAEVERVAKDREALVKKAQEDEKLKAALEQRAGDNPELKAMLYGAGRGGAGIVGAIAAAKTVGPAAAAITAMTPLAPFAPAVGLVAGTGAAIVGGVGGTQVFDKMYEGLANPAPGDGSSVNMGAAMSAVGGLSPSPAAFANPEFTRSLLDRHFQEYDSVLAASKLKPEWKLGGELSMAAVAMATSVPQAVRGFKDAAAAEGARGVARLAAQAGGTGAATGAAAVPIAGAMTGEPYTAGDVATGAGAGLLFSGFFVGNRRIPDERVYGIVQKQMAGVGLDKDEARIYRALEVPMRRLMATIQAEGGAAQAAGSGRRPVIDLNVSQSGVPGFRPFTVARPTAEFYAPPRLPAAAAAGAQPAAEAMGPRTAGPAAAMADPVTPVPRTAPVNVVPAATEPIVIPPAAASVAAAEAIPNAEDLAAARITEQPLPMAAARRPTETTTKQPMAVDEGKDKGYGTINDSAANEASGRADSPSPAQSAAAYTRSRSEAIRAASPGRSQFSTEFEALVEWGGNAGLISEDPPATRPPDAKGREHEVWFDDSSERVLKATYPQKFGLALSSNGEATPAQYMERIALNNALFGDDIRIERMSNENGRLRVVTSQPTVDAPSASDPEIENFFKDLGFAKKTQGDRTFFYNKDIGVVAYDAHRGNVLKRGNQVIPIDVGLQRVTPALAKALGVEPPKGTLPVEQPTVAAPTDEPPITERRAGGGATVPPGQQGPQPVPPTPRPAWLNEPGETSAGRRLIKGIQNYKPGQQWNFQAIVDHVAKAVKMEVRYSRSQTSRTHPAHYKTEHRVAYSSDPQDPLNFHEAGHGLEFLMRARVPDFWDAHEAELLALAQRPGSVASNPPAGATANQARQYRIGEGVAEWLRLLTVEPGAVDGLQVTPALNAAVDRYYPKTSAALRDAARAVNVFNDKDPLERWMMFYMAPTVKPTVNDYVGAIIRGGEKAMQFIASGAPVSALDRKITRAIIDKRKETETPYLQAVKRARENRKTNLTPMMSAYNGILSIGAETQLAISGKGPSKGLRWAGQDGKIKYVTQETWEELRRKVPQRKLWLFDAAAFASEALNRWENGKMPYAGMRQGITPDDLRAIVELARKEIPNRDVMFKEQNEWLNTLVKMMVEMGLITPEDGQNILTARPEQYWPMPKAMPAGRRGGGGFRGGEIRAGVYRAFGSGGPYRQVDEVVEERVRQMFEAHYWNNFGLTLYNNMRAVAADDRLPMAARQMAGAQMIKLKMPMRSAAKVSKEEALSWVMDALADSYEKVLGYRPTVKPEDVNLSWNFKDVWRPVKPEDVNVVTLREKGEPVFVQVGDPGMFAMFTESKTAGKMAKFWAWALGPMTENWKRAITQGPVFAVRSLYRAMFSQPIMNPDAIGWVPGWAHWKGAVNKWTQKYPQVFSEGLLLSRVEPSSAEMVNAMKHGAVWQWLTEGWYVSQAKDPVVRTLATVLNPSNLLFPFWKTADLINLIAPGAAVGGALGGVPGAIAGAVVGPALGVTGARMAQFVETSEREGAAVAVLQRGGSDMEALAKYWTAAGQFNEHSSIAGAKVAMRIPGFVNPMLQGVRNAFQNLSDPDPVRAGTTWLRLLAMMPVIFGGAAVARYLFMSEDDKEKERQRPVDDRMNFMDIGGFAIPFPFGVEGVMGSLVYNATMDDLLSRPKVDSERVAMMLLKRIADPGSTLQFFGPQLATLTEASMNWANFRQKHIVSPWMVNLPAADQYYSTTPEFYRKLGEWANYSPAKIQYIVQQALSRQVDETIRLAESMDNGRPIQEKADVPFVGRMFVRDPIGFGSQSVRSVTALEEKLQRLDMRLKAKGWHSLRDAEFDTENLPSRELRMMHMQLQYLDQLRQGLAVLSDMQGVGKYYSLKRDFANERNMRTMQTQYAQSLLIGNQDRIAVLEQALELIKQIPDAPPEQKAAEYLERRF